MFFLTTLRIIIFKITFDCLLKTKKSKSTAII